ncbi:hypothetical protein [Haloferula sp. BvORR071]|uniref:hypothetical protein n=1 Tax=Haloferula sp. BvORR071 TaxID=1396141 RepID=UPI00069792B5|nr:hypothetical protein [Haloferula sp. BvORR071]
MAQAKLITSGLAALAIAAASTLTGCGGKTTVAKKKAAPVVVEVSLPPPPPVVIPPPPPKEEPPPPEEQKPEMVEQAPVEETPPDPGPVDEPPQLGTNMAPGNGPDNGYGVGGKGNGGGNGRGSIGGQGGSRFGRQALMIQNTVAGELRRNPKTKSAVFSGKVALWVDSSGRITKAKAVGTLGGSGVDESVPATLIGLQFPEALPSDMPMPVQMRVAGRKVN